MSQIHKNDDVRLSKSASGLLSLLLLDHGLATAGQGAAALTHACLCHGHLEIAFRLGAAIYVALLVTLRQPSPPIGSCQHQRLNLIGFAGSLRLVHVLEEFDHRHGKRL